MFRTKFESKIKSGILAGALFVFAAASSSAANASIIVPGTADIWAWNGIASPDDQVGSLTSDISPVLALSSLAGIASVTITATGETSHCPSCYVSNGAGAVTSHLDGATNGIPDLKAPIDSLVGAWINPADPAVDTAFEIGTGGKFVVPTGATELFLGSMDSYQWNNNVGQFSVTLKTNLAALRAPTRVPEPLSVTLLGAGLAGTFVVRRRKSPRTASS